MLNYSGESQIRQNLPVTGRLNYRACNLSIEGIISPPRHVMDEMVLKDGL